LNSLKEYDLLLISKEEIPDAANNVKKLTSKAFLLDLA